LFHGVNTLRVAHYRKLHQIESDSPGAHEHTDSFETIEHFQIFSNFLIDILFKLVSQGFLVGLLGNVELEHVSDG